MTQPFVSERTYCGASVIIFRWDGQSPKVITFYDLVVNDPPRFRFSNGSRRVSVVGDLKGYGLPKLAKVALSRRTRIG